MNEQRDPVSQLIADFERDNREEDQLFDRVTQGDESLTYAESKRAKEIVEERLSELAQFSAEFGSRIDEAKFDEAKARLQNILNLVCQRLN